MRALSAVLVLATVTACASAGRTTASPESARSADGMYEFSANTPGQLIRGTLKQSAEGTGVQFETTCQREATVRARPKNMPTTGLSYYCSGAWLTFDRQNPAQAKWFASIELPRRREVCSRYETQNGRQVCVSRTTETYYVYEPRSGGIQVRRLP